MIKAGLAAARTMKHLSVSSAVATVAGALAISWLPAQDAATQAPSKAPLRFTGPEIVKLDWNTRCPRIADFNGDGLPDIALLNLDRSRIEFLLQGKEGPKAGQGGTSSRRDLWSPLLELSRFEKQPLVTGESMYGLAVGDWNGDKRPDVAYTTDGRRLVLRIHGAEAADWTNKREFPLDSVSDAADSLIAAELNKDARTDLALITDTRLMIFLQDDKGGWQEPRSYALSDSGSAGLRAADLNGDGRVDLFSTTKDADAVLVRLQSADGGFGEEWRLEIPEAQSWATSVHVGQGVALGYLQASTGMVELARLTTAASAADLDHAASVRHSIPQSDAKTGATAWGDVTGDGVVDVVLAEPKRARVWVFIGGAEGTFAEGVEFPSLSGVEAMSIEDLDGDKQAELVVLSPAEKCVAVARWEKEKGRLAYPEVIHQSEEAITAMTTGIFGAASEPVVLCAKESKPKATLLSLRWNATEKKFVSESHEFPSPPAKVSALRLVDADQDGKGDVAVFSTFANMQIMLSRPDAKPALKKVEGLPDSLTSKLPAGALTQADLDGDGKAELIAAKDQLARVFKVDAEGKAKILEQFNAPDPSAQLAAAVVIPDAHGKGKTVLLVDTAAEEIHELTADAAGVFRVHRSRKTGVSSVEGVRLLDSAAGRLLLLLSRQSFDLLPLEGRSLGLEKLASFTTDLTDTNPADLMAAPFTQGKVDDLLLLDTTKTRVAEFFRSASPEGRDWQSFLYFRIFQADPHYRGKTGFDTEPHDYAAMDLNQDGKLDLCVLAHDRLLLYVQQ
ncbi:hypothetical protein AYO49_04300 [Verrucomicrobiaceae bacterium SCGC AG-212-N21]|nr:hypothetical protein AYO49_04300 [Verrucomicrobiaceae bacterium SCGC AG-212-N21]